MDNYTIHILLLVLGLFGLCLGFMGWAFRLKDKNTELKRLLNQKMYNVSDAKQIINERRFEPVTFRNEVLINRFIDSPKLESDIILNQMYDSLLDAAKPCILIESIDEGTQIRLKGRLTIINLNEKP